MQDQRGRDAAGNAGHHVLVLEVREQVHLAIGGGRRRRQGAAGRAALHRRHDGRLRAFGRECFELMWMQLPRGCRESLQPAVWVCVNVYYLSEFA